MRMNLILYLLVFVLFMAKQGIAREDVTVLASFTNTNAPGVQRFLKSAKIHGIKIENLSEWKEFNKTRRNILWRKLVTLENKKLPDHIILLVHSHDVIFQSGLDEIVKRFKKFDNTRVLFAAKHYCLPERNLAKFYPKKHLTTFYPYLNSGGIIGYLVDIFGIIHYMRIYDLDPDDQLAYTKMYLKDSLRKSFKISLDNNATIFQNLADSQAYIELEKIDDEMQLINTETGQRPLIIHGDGDQGKQLMRMLSPFLLGNQSREGMSPKLLDSILRKFSKETKKTGPSEKNSIFPSQQLKLSTPQLFHPASKGFNGWPAPFTPTRNRFRTEFPQDHWKKNNFFTHIEATSMGKHIFD